MPIFSGKTLFVARASRIRQQLGVSAAPDRRGLAFPSPSYINLIERTSAR